MRKTLALLVLFALIFSIVAPFAVLAEAQPADGFENSGGNSSLTSLTNKTKEVGGGVWKLIRTYGQIALTILIAWLGVRWFSTKSGTERKDLKDGLINLLVGAIIFVAASKIFDLLWDIGSQLLGATPHTMGD